jgi:hypothetical protein
MAFGPRADKTAQPCTIALPAEPAFGFMSMNYIAFFEAKTLL